MSNKKRLKSRTKRESPGPRRPVFTTYEITDEPIVDKSLSRLPLEVRDNIEKLYFTVNRNPKEAIPQLSELIQKYPDVPLFYNLLSSAYLNAGNQEKANEITIEYYRKYPDYLFARISYGLLCLNAGEVDKIPEVFQHKFDLKALYPGRKKFHISEVTSFAYLMGVYFHKTGEKEYAELYYRMLNQVVPKHPMTGNLKRMLHPSLLKRILRKVLRIRD